MRRLGEAWRALERWERLVLIGALVAGVALRLGYVLANLDIRLGGDEPIYHQNAILQTEGNWFWSVTPTGAPHESFWKAPIYQTWVGIWYSLAGTDVDNVRAVQAVASIATILLGWLLARRLFGPVAAAITAGVLAIYPNVWQFDVRLFTEVLATPLTVAVLLVVLTRPPTVRGAALAGALTGVSLLVRPSAVLLFAGIAVLWWMTTGFKRGTALTAVAAGVAILVVAPWTIRNLTVDSDHFIPISAQDAAAYGTFNDDAANDPDQPWKWRAIPARDREIVSGASRLSEGELHAELRRRTQEYISDHPDAVPKAFFWNGIVRLWDLHRPSRVTDDAKFGHRGETLALLGLLMYWPLLALALLGLYRLWRSGRRPLVLSVLALALAASVIYTSDSKTRYRAPLEPLIVVLAAGVLSGAAARASAAPARPPSAPA